MKNKKKIILDATTITLALFMSCTFIVLVIIVIVSRSNINKINKFESIEMGYTDTQVINILGEPEDIDRRKKVPQTHGRSEEYGKEIDNPNKAFWYSTGIDYLAVYIFDENNKVIYINLGGT